MFCIVRLDIADSDAVDFERLVRGAYRKGSDFDSLDFAGYKPV